MFVWRMGSIKSRLLCKSDRNSMPFVTVETPFTKEKEYLLDLYREYKLTESDKARAAHVCQDLQKILNHMSSSCCKAVIVGSCLSGIGLRGADVDITIVPTIPDNTGMETVVSALQAESNVEFKFETYLSRARVPIIKLIHRATSSEVDVSWNRPENEDMARILKRYSSISPLIEPLIVLLKLWAASRCLLHPPSGFLGGFQLSLMLIFHQQQQNKLEALPRGHLGYWNHSVDTIVDEETVADQFIDFFRFYSDFNFINVIDIRDRRIYTKLDLNDSTGQWWSPIAIVHPITGLDGGNHGACVRPGPMNAIIKAFSEMAAFNGDLSKVFHSSDHMAS